MYVMRIEPAAARAVLFEEADKARMGQGNAAWTARIDDLHRLCGKVARTHIAAFGTALIAKAVDINVDVFALKRTKGGPRAYAAREIAKDVLAAHAPELEIDIGVYGREPLNNQPYFRESRISREMPVRANARPALDHLCAMLDLVDRIETEDKARELLRTYIIARRKHFVRHVAQLAEGTVTVSELFARIEIFMKARSEGGKRAQALVAGLLEVAYGSSRVRTSRVNDPDRGLPADVGVSDAQTPGRWERVFEVRDKPVSEADLHHLVRKASTNGVTRAAMFALAGSQTPIQGENIQARAREAGVELAILTGWNEALHSILFASTITLDEFATASIGAIDNRLIELEVESETLKTWRAERTT